MAYKCSKCGCTETYSKGSRGFRRCKECHKVRTSLYYQTETYKTSNRARSRFTRHSGGTWEEYRALEAKQECKCAVCGRQYPPGKLHFDHCHATKQKRGLLCPACNGGLGCFRDSTALLENAVRYLKLYGK